MLVNFNINLKTVNRGLDDNTITDSLEAELNFLIDGSPNNDASLQIYKESKIWYCFLQNINCKKFFPHV